MITKQGYISSSSNSVVEDIEVKINQVLSIIDKKTGDIVITALMKSFTFKKSLMQEHFNENYVESDKSSKAVFKDKTNNFEGKSPQQKILMKQLNILTLKFFQLFEIILPK
jgi:hypothetical protein